MNKEQQTRGTTIIKDNNRDIKNQGPENEELLQNILQQQEDTHRY